MYLTSQKTLLSHNLNVLKQNTTAIVDSTERLKEYFHVEGKDKAGMNLQSVQGRMYYFKTLHVCPGRQTIAFLKAYHFCFTAP